MPQHVLSDRPIPGPYLHPDDIPPTALTDYELGGIALRDPSQGLQVQVWTFGYDGANVWASAPSVAQTTLFTLANVTQLSGAFDQNMNPAVAFIAAGIPQLWWFDTVAHAQVFTTFTGINSPRVAMDDKRSLETQVGSNDVIFAYLKSGGLYFRAQRDRYGVEYPLTTIDPAYTFVQMGMNSVNRFQFQFHKAGISPP